MKTLTQCINESITKNTKQLINKIQKLIKSCGGHIDVSEDDIEELQISDGGEYHGVESIDLNGVNMDDGDFYEFSDLESSDFDMLIEYIEWYINENK